jgi:hypothetical protein
MEFDNFGFIVIFAEIFAGGDDYGSSVQGRNLEDEGLAGGDPQNDSYAPGAGI